ncbi:hypothetical protein DF3PB_10045 [uncultured Defluviicoccus sp.]|uniref:Helix-turn-helix domain-containing protein n=1 Tax=metagenome TaxID=256318 RepID=A0A380T9G8_9ZZZZ|nr:hypothetical protein DF3PB_10045 [uncultured Defluviicoccus sp.]
MESDMSGNPSTPKFAKIRDVCILYGLGRTKVAELIKSGQLRAVKIGSATLVDIEAADQFFAQLPTAARVRERRMQR